MSLTGTAQLNFSLREIEGTFTGDELQTLLDANGDNAKLAQADALEMEASKVAFQFSAGEVSANKLEYYKHLCSLAKQAREAGQALAADYSSTVSWSGSAAFGTAEVEEWIDLEYNDPEL